MYIPNDNTQICSFCRLKSVETFEHSTEWIDQSKQSPQIRKRCYKTLGTSVIYSPLSSRSLLKKLPLNSLLSCPENSISTLSQNRMMLSPACINTPPFAWAVFNDIFVYFLCFVLCRYSFLLKIVGNSIKILGTLIVLQPLDKMILLICTSLNFILLLLKHI